MEEARRRLATLSSHLLLYSPISVSSTSTSQTPLLKPSGCSSSSFDDAEKGNLKRDCIFCKIVRGDSPAIKLYEDDVCLCILDSNPVSHGHSLIIPKSHFPSLQATPPHVLGAMCSKVPIISSAVIKTTGADSFNLLVNNGVAAGQVIFHTHFHIIPRKARDCLWTSESLPRRPLKWDQETSQLADRIRTELLSSKESEDSKDEELFISKEPEDNKDQEPASLLKA